jgi:iron complex outermembrane receptor protein
VSSNGYIDRASSDLKSFYLSTAWLNKNSSLRFNLFSGKEKTYQAWYGVPGNMLATNRTYNPAGKEKPGTPYDNQTDNYIQTHYQLFFNHTYNSKWSFNTAAFLTRGYGYYEEYKAGASFADYGLPNTVIGSTTIIKSDLVRQRWLDNYFYGQIAAVQYKHSGDELTIGGGWTLYDGKHFGTIPWVQVSNAPKDYRYYDYPAVKKDAHSYVKWQHRINSQWSGFADLQYRHVNHTMNGFEGNGNLNVNRSFDFINPKAGITYHNNGWQWYVSYALGNKEPNRDDFQASPVNQPKQETLHDLELGIEQRNRRYFLAASLYYMYYHNQLVLTGQINDVGSYTRINIPDSYRLGAELQAGATLARWINFAGNLAISRNKIKSFTEYIDNYDTGGQDAVAHKNTDISFSPSLVGVLTINLLPVHNLTFSLLNKYVGKQYMDNSQDDHRKLDPYFTEGLQLSWVVANKGLKEWYIIARVNNLFDKKYEPNGYTYNYTSSNKLVTENGYYPMAGTNFMLGINVKL